MENLKLRMIQAKAKLCLSLGLTVACSACFHENDQYFGKLSQGGQVVIPSPQASGSPTITDSALGQDSSEGSNSSGSDSETSDDHSGDVDSDENIENTNTPTVCDPFKSNDDVLDDTLSTDHGIKASLKYMTASNVKKYAHSSVQNFVDHGTASSAEIYFSSVNVPTRKFDQGFVSEQGTPLKDDSGKTLIENFLLQFESNIRFAKGAAKMKVQFAVLSDDGTNVSIKSGENWQTLINNDGNHPTKMGCATSPVEISSDSSLPIKIDYYQGPRYHIAVVLLWREWKDDASFESKDAMCGQSGNSLFFDSEYTPSRESNAYLNLLSNGWSVVPKDVYYLDANISDDTSDVISKVNPCIK